MTTQRMFDVVKAKRCLTCQQRFTSEAAFCPFDGERLVEAEGIEPGKDPLIGTLVDNRYEILESLGEGGMGAVYRVRHKVLSRMFAMKILRREMAREKELCARFIQEARAAATIAHANVVQINDYGNLPDGTPYFVMELLEGNPLSKVIKLGALPAGRAVRIVQQIASGLGAAHRAGVVHRDLKPDNVFVCELEDGKDSVKILDFGVAKVAGSASMTKTGMVFGSPHYMSPEQASGQPVDHRADIYAMGVIMYELFTGRVPFEADTFMGVLTKHMFMAPESFEVRVGDAARELGALEDITLRCLEKKPENRFPTMEALVEAIDEVVELCSDDRIDVRPSSVGSERRSALSSFRLADEMEPPLPGEVSAARARRGARDRGTRLALVAMIVAGCMFVVAVALVAWSRGRGGAAAIPETAPGVTTVGAGASPTASSAAGIAVPPTVSVMSSSQAPASASMAVQEPAPSKAEPARTTPRWTPPRTTAPSTATAAPTATAPKKQPAGGGEIVNPWAD